jgi:dienelactone hydrolase
MQRARRRRARQRRALVLAVVVFGGLAATLVAVLSPGSGPPGPSRGRGHPSTTTHPTSGPTPGVVGTYGVASVSVTFSEPAAAAGGSSRALPTEVWYPTPPPGRAPRRGFPLLAFSQGFDLAVSAYAGLITDWASAGYVVAAPTYPGTDPSDQGGLNEEDIVNHPADLRFVITSVLSLAAGTGSVLSGRVDPAAVGVVGHSDGGEVSLAVAANSCCRDPRVKAAVILSGAELAAFGAPYFASGSVPLLAVQGDSDTINPPACSVQFYDAAPSPKYYLDLLGAGHEPPYTDPGGTDQRLVSVTTTDFFDAELYGQRAALAAMVAAGSVAGVGAMVSGGPAPATSGDCPGA